VTYDVRGTTGYVAGYFARGDRYRATFQLSLRMEGGSWRIAVDNVIPTAPVIAPRPVTSDSLIAELNTAGIRYGVILSLAYFFAGPDYVGSGDEEASVRAENDWTSAQAAQHPDRLVGFCGVNPLKPYSTQEIERCARLPRMVGVKLHFGNSQVTLQNPEHVEALRRLFAVANRLRLPIIAHIAEFKDYGREQAEIFLTEILPAAPDIPIQIAHMAGAGPGYGPDAAFAVFASARQSGDARMKNVFVDVASNVVAGSSREEMELVAKRLRQFGLDHVLFGSDRIPTLLNEDPRTAWLSFRRLPLTDDEFSIIARNVAPYLR
jgi:predicted TIM-barrel fold metal-dependent hydrolase